MTNPWLAHVKKTMREHPGQTFTTMLKRASRTYKNKKGGKKKKKMKKTRRKRKNKGKKKN
tara:strand:- start:846 stop:1025 length:180 start_codon:yes stop_codon:yes gene_type:complete